MEIGLRICAASFPHFVKQMAANPWKRPGVLLGAATVYVGSAAFAYLSFYEPKADEASLEEVSDARRLQVFNANATKYDKGASRLVGHTLIIHCVTAMRLLTVVITVFMRIL